MTTSITSRREIAPGATWAPGWLTLDHRVWIVARFSEWVAGPVPIRSGQACASVVQLGGPSDSRS